MMSQGTKPARKMKIATGTVAHKHLRKCQGTSSACRAHSTAAISFISTNGISKHLWKGRNQLAVGMRVLGIVVCGADEGSRVQVMHSLGECTSITDNECLLQIRYIGFSLILGCSKASLQTVMIWKI